MSSSASVHGSAKLVWVNESILTYLPRCKSTRLIKTEQSVLLLEIFEYISSLYLLKRS